MSVTILLVVLGALALSGLVTLRHERKAPPIGRFVEFGSHRLHVLDLNADAKGPPIVLIHGASVNLRDMKLALGEELAKTHRVIIFDRPGRGYSSRPSDGWRLDRQAEIIHEALGALGVEKPVIVGQSLGGAVALAYALKFQKEMTGLVLLAPVSHDWPGGVAWYNAVSGAPVIGTVFRWLLISFYGPLAAKAGVKGSFAPNDAPADYYESSGLSLLFRPDDFRANAEDLVRLKPQIIEMSRRYGEITIPTAILSGTSDRTVSHKRHSERLASDIPGASLDLLPKTGHALHHAETPRVAAAIRRIAAGQAAV